MNQSVMTLSSVNTASANRSSRAAFTSHPRRSFSLSTRSSLDVAAPPTLQRSTISSDEENCYNSSSSISRKDELDDDYSTSSSDDEDADYEEEEYGIKRKSSKSSKTTTRSCRSTHRHPRTTAVSTTSTAAAATAPTLAVSTVSTTSSSTLLTPPSVRPIARGGVTCPFPWKLHDMLEHCMMPENGTVQDGDHDDTIVNDPSQRIVTWNEDGTAFGVLNAPLFVQTILPLFFAQSKYASFQRQLNLYGFERMSGPRPTANAGHAVEATATDHGHHNTHHHSMMSYYHHPSFVRGRKELVVNMIRCKVKGTGNCHHKPVPQLPLPSQQQQLPTDVVASETATETMASKSKKRTRASVVASSSNDSPAPSSPRGNSRSNSRQSKKRRASTGSTSTPQEQPALPTVISPKAPRVSSSSPRRGSNNKGGSTNKMPVRMVSMTAPSLSTAAEQATPLAWPDEWDDDVMSLSDEAAAANASTTKTNTTATSSAATATVISPLDGDLLYFEGSPFHYLDTILPDLVNPGTSTVVPQETNAVSQDDAYATAPIQMVESPRKMQYQHTLPPPLPLFPVLEGCVTTTASTEGATTTDHYILTDDHDAMYGGYYRSHNSTANTNTTPSWAVSSPRQQLLQSRSRTTRMAIYNTCASSSVAGAAYGEHSPNSSMWGKRAAAAAATTQPFMLYNNNDTLIFPC